MGSFAQETADAYGITREEMDAYAIESLKRAQNAINSGWLASEIVPVTVTSRKGEVLVKDDEQPLNANLDKIPTLKPAFRKDGSITAANATQSQDPSEFTIAPIGAISNLLKKAGWDKADVDLFEINEAFAMVTMLAMREHDLDHAKVNIYGGACAQGHPVGSTGSRIIITLIHAPQRTRRTRG